MKQKKSFQLYHDYWDCFKLLSDEELGKLLRTIYLYERENIYSENLDIKIEMAFSMIKKDLDRNRLKYEQICKRNKEIAKLRWQKIRECNEPVNSE